MPEPRPRITVVNDNPDFLQLMQDVLQDATYPATLIDGDRENALELLVASEPEVLVIDLRMGTSELHGIDILRQAREHPDLHDVPTIVCTADRWALQEHEDELRGMGRVAFLPKPFSIDELYAAIDGLLA